MMVSAEISKLQTIKGLGLEHIFQRVKLLNGLFEVKTGIRHASHGSFHLLTSIYLLYFEMIISQNTFDQDQIHIDCRRS